ncbi:MAG: DUF2336 domain-containing protein [Alphaproteobacteria bacterium]|nr:DUF2336 domain-containing protein [Alphaproteobacteria bacterium]
MSDKNNKPEEQAFEVNILDSKQLLQYAQDTTEMGRFRLANAVAQFFDEKKLSKAEQALTSEIMLNLIRQAEIDLREALAERLSVLSNVPSDVIVYLANDTISVARPILQHSPVLSDVDLIYIIASKDEDYWDSIAKREKIGSVVTDRLIDTGNPKTILSLIDNQRVVLQKNCLKKLIKVSLKSEELQASLLRRPEIDGDLAVGLYTCASQYLRREITERFNLPIAVIETALESLVEELSQEVKGSRKVTPEMIALAGRFMERDEISPDLMIKTLRRSQISFFIALFATKINFTPEAVMKLLQKEEGKSFALACRSIGMMKSEFASIFLLSRGISTGDRIVDQRALAMALKYYDTIKEFEIKRIMKSLAKNQE